MKNHDNYTKNLQLFWQTKEFRSSPALVGRYMRQDPNISLSAISCWQAIKDIAIFDDNWCAQISKNELAYALDTSAGSIARYLKMLEKAGYINKKGKKINNVWQTTSYQITLPLTLFKLLEETPDRKQATTSKNSSYMPSSAQTTVGSSHSRQLFHVEQSSQNKQSGQDKNFNCSYSGHYGPINSSKLFHVEQSENLLHAKEDNSIKLLEGKLPNRSDQDDTSHMIIMDIGSDHNRPTNKNNNNLNNKYNNTTVVETKNLKKKATQLIHQASKKTNKDEQMALLSQFGKLDAHIRALEDGEQSTTKCSSNAQVEKSSTSYLARAGGRTFPENIVTRVKQRLSDTFQEQAKADVMLNEIAYAIRFGGLQVSYKNNKPMSLEHSVNVALKLVREGRWQRPQGMVSVA